jgi:hypothetical protein
VPDLPRFPYSKSHFQCLISEFQVPLVAS